VHRGDCGFASRLQAQRVGIVNSHAGIPSRTAKKLLITGCSVLQIEFTMGVELNCSAYGMSPAKSIVGETDDSLLV
jgi:hypothetical protein